MTFFDRSAIALLLIAGLVLPFSVACERAEEQGPAEELGEKIDELVDDVRDEGESVGDKLEEAGEEIEEAAEDVKDEIEGDG